MRKGIYLVWDIVSEMVLGTVFLMPHDAAAVREFVEALQNPQSLGRRPKDYELRCVGVLDESTCHVIDGSATRTVLTGEAWQASLSEGPKLAAAE